MNDYAKYSSIAIQTVLIICIGVWFGIKMDSWCNTKPLFIVIFSLLSVFGAIYTTIKKILK
ncbi:MAG: AtpZ/AtpI family protein [Bacteroidales bacterium]|jgi:F0F1-type ATP synthase assembly protein I|nr:AtpZ/AtpI family protein [Bacteroidales bacterium]